MSDARTAPSAPAASASFARLDRRLLEAVRGIRILQTVEWPAAVEQRFLEELANGRDALPQAEYAAPRLAGARAELDAIVRAADPDHPIGAYLARSARSWADAAGMLEAVGTPAVSARSIELFGQPTDPLPGGGETNLDAARFFLALADELDDRGALPETDYCISAATLRDELQAAVDTAFGRQQVRVEVDPDLTAKAAAGTRRIRLRGATRFSAYDREQILAHEAFVHTLTARNGRAQPVLRSLSRTAPRAAMTQEGLAVFAECMTGAIDLTRLKRISLRIVAIDMALRGADFIEVFRWFRDQGLNAAGSFRSTARIYRGVPLTGGAAFTKDNVYLAGLLTVHAFAHWALKQRRPELVRDLFAGKLALDDVIALQPCFADGTVAPPRYLPAWVRRPQGFAGALALSAFADRIRVGRIGDWG